MRILINGKPVYEAVQHTCGSHESLCQADAYIRHLSEAHPATDVTYRYIANMAEDICEPTYQISTIVGKALWNDANSMYDHIANTLVSIFGS